MCEKLTIEVAKTVAKKYKGICLSNKYLNCYTDLIWQCNKKHKWRANLNSVKNKNTWCPYCAGRKLDKKMVMEIVKKKGGRCHLNKYINYKQTILCECNKKHKWKVKIKNIMAGHWCKKCVNDKMRFSILDAQKIAKSHKGWCLSKKYINNDKKLLWMCFNNHKWKETYSSINSGRWCHKCDVDRRKHKLDYVEKIAFQRGGACLSKKYKNANKKLKFRCKNGHFWRATFHSVKDMGSWCPTCGYIKAAKSLNNSYILKHWKTKEELVCVASYEKSVVEYLNKEKINFKWQSKTFKMPSGETYRPDLYLHSAKKWIEIKGYMRIKNEKKWKWFHKKYPNSQLWNEAKLKKLGII